MATITITKLHTLLSQKMGSETAESLTAFIEEKINEEIKGATNEIATKDFVGSEIAQLETKLERGFKEQARWMLGVFITLVVLILGLYATVIFKK